MVAFADAVADAVNSFTGAFDVAPQAINIDANNPSSNVDIDALLFPPSEVQAVSIFYSVFRETDTENASEAGNLEATYNPDAGTWELTRTGTGDGKISFDITNLGQIRFTTEAITGSNHTGYISFRALAVLSSNE
jgi:hypothetical protein